MLVDVDLTRGRGSLERRENISCNDGNSSKKLIQTHDAEMAGFVMLKRRASAA